MDLVLSSAHPYNATYFIAEGGNQGPPMFLANSKHKLWSEGDVTIETLGGDSGSTLLAEIKLHSKLFKYADEVTVKGRRLQPSDHGCSWKSVKFTAADGRTYKWKLHGMLDRHAKLEVEGQTAGEYDKGSKHLFSANEPATLRIYPEALSAVEDIITMLAYLVKRRDVTTEEVVVATA